MISIDVKLVKKLISSQFPQWSNLEISPVLQMGNDNRTFHLGSTMSVRLPSDKCYSFQSEKEQFWLPKLKGSLPLLIPNVIENGNISDDYPYPWSICSWIDGETVKKSNISNMNQLAEDLANFLIALESIDCTNGPLAGEHNFYRGGDLSMFWTFFEGDSKSIFKHTMNLDDNTWNRSMGWVLWKSLITFDQFKDKDLVKSHESKKIINDIIKKFS